MLKFISGIAGGKSPIDNRLSLVAFNLQGANLSPLGRDRKSLLCYQLLGGLVETHNGALWIMGFRVEVQDVLHTRHEVGAHSGMHNSFFCHGLSSFFSVPAAPSPGR